MGKLAHPDEGCGDLTEARRGDGKTELHQGRNQSCFCAPLSPCTCSRPCFLNEEQEDPFSFILN